MAMQRNQQGQFIKGTNGNLFEGFGVWYDCKGYPCIYVDGKSIKIHILVWERTNGTKPKGYEIHHKDFNKGNYELSNLQLITLSNHRKLHAGWVIENNDWVAKPCNLCGKVLPLKDFYPRKGYTPCALCKHCHNLKVAERRTKLNPEEYRQYKHNYYLRKTEGKNVKRRCQDAIQRTN